MRIYLRSLDLFATVTLTLVDDLDSRDLDLDILKMYMHAENEACMSMHLKVTGRTDRQSDRTQYDAAFAGGSNTNTKYWFEVELAVKRWSPSAKLS